MTDLIYDAYSIFFQILQLFAPEHAGDTEFLMIGYAFACLFILTLLWTLLQMLSAFSRLVMSWFNKGC